MKRFLTCLVLAALPEAASAQYLSEEIQQRERALWEKTGVDFPQGMKFYSFDRLGQRIVSIVNRSSEGFGDSHHNGIYASSYGGANNINKQAPWNSPGGLTFSPKSQWRNAKAAYIPGLIEVFREPVPVHNGSNYQTERRVSWRYPSGTMFADVLIRKNKDGSEHVFEIRLREKTDGKWDDGTAYRPYAGRDLLPAGSVAYNKSWMNFANLNKLGTGKVVFPLEYVPAGTPLPKGKFVPSRVVATADDDDSFVPRDYMGNGFACIKCHQHAGEPTSYGATAISGADSVLSHHPFTNRTVNSDATPVVDERIAKWIKGR